MAFLPTEERGQRWFGALTSIVAQALLFMGLNYLLGDFISALVIIVLNIGLALTYKSSNPYLIGARWATFFSISLSSYARHHYWYQDMLDSFSRLNDFYVPIGALERLCQGNPSDIAMVGITSIGILIFYFIVTQWDDWKERWELVRRSTFSASLGFQVLIFTAVAWPSVLTLTGALFFAAIISPLLRRQVRINHIVFLVLVPLFAFSNFSVALIWTFLAGFLFLYAVGVEKSLTGKAASFSFFLGVTFLMLTYSLTASKIVAASPGMVGGLAALFGLILALSLALLLLLRGQVIVSKLNQWAFFYTHPKVKDHHWWSIRDLWVAREVHTRDEKMYTRENTPFTIGTVFFGPRDWPANSENPPVPMTPKVNMVPTILVLAFYSLWFLIDAVIHLVGDNRTLSLLCFVGGTLITLALPLFLLLKESKVKFSLATLGNMGMAFFGLMFYGMYMISVVSAGLFNSTNLQDAAQSANAAQEQRQESYFTCSPQEERPLFNGKLFE